MCSVWVSVSECVEEQPVNTWTWPLIEFATFLAQENCVISVGCSAAGQRDPRDRHHVVYRSGQGGRNQAAGQPPKARPDAIYGAQQEQVWRQGGSWNTACSTYDLMRWQTLARDRVNASPACGCTWGFVCGTARCSGYGWSTPPFRYRSNDVNRPARFCFDISSPTIHTHTLVPPHFKTNNKCACSHSHPIGVTILSPTPMNGTADTRGCDDNNSPAQNASAAR